MRPVHLPLLPLPVLAVLVAISACTKPRPEEVSHLVPPPLPALAAFAPAPAPAGPPPAAAPVAEATAPAEEAPSPEEVAAFERRVPK